MIVPCDGCKVTEATDALFYRYRYGVVRYWLNVCAGCAQPAAATLRHLGRHVFGYGDPEPHPSQLEAVESA